MNVFDIGANIGYYTIFFLNKIKKGKVLAIEPSSENLKLCQKNIELNNLNKNINFVTAGVSDVNKKKVFYVKTVKSSYI